MRLRALQSAVVLVSFSTFATPPDAGANSQPHAVASTKKPGSLNELARSIVRKRMDRHGKVMTMLVQGVILLQRDVVSEVAASIASEPRLTRPIAGGANDVNAALPERFFILQDELKERAQALGLAAKQTDDDALAKRFAELTRTCVACHSAFLDPDQIPRKIDDPQTH